MTSTAPSVSTTVLTFVLVIGWRLGEPFRVQTPFLLTQGSGASCRKTLKYGSASPHQLPRQRRGTTSTASVSAGSKPSGNGTERSYSDSGGVEDTARPARAVATVAANGTSKDREAEAERLRQEVFANEKGFLESQAFNPRRAKEKEEEEEVRRMAAQWDSTPEKAREVMTKTGSKEDLSFQELESIARDLNLADEQQRVFMMKAGIKKLADATTLPKRRQQQQQQQHRDPVGEAVTERIFAAESGFVQNSEEFKNKLKAGSGVRFDLRGLPLLDEGDPVVQAARQSKQNATFDLEGIVFPTLPDCPRCSTPTTDEELSQFKMCAQCKAHEISAVVYTGPSSPSKYTYDTGEPPFSDSWQQRNAGQRSDKTTKSEGEGSAIFRGSGGGSRDAAGPDPGVAKVVTASTRGGLGSGAKLRRGTLAGRSPVPPPGGRKAWPPPGPDEPVLPPSQQKQRTLHEAAVAAATAPAGTVSSSSSPRPGGAPSSTKSNSPGRDHPSYSAAAGVTAQPGPSDRPLRRDPSRGQSAAPPQAAAVAAATVEETAAVVRRLSGEVAEFRSKLAALGAAMRSNKVGGTKGEQEERHSAAAPPVGPAVRELRREVAELRSALKAVAERQAEAERSKAAGSSDSSSIYRSNSANSVYSSGGGEGATTVRKLSREVTELRSQLEQARREQSLTQLALRRLREQVDSLTAGGTTQ